MRLILFLALASLLPGLIGCASSAKKQAEAPVAEAPKPAEPGGQTEEFAEFQEEFGKKPGQEAKPVFDPLRGYNRFMFHFNDKFYFWVGKPLSLGYNFILPQPVRVAVARGFVNLAAPLRMVNSALQLKMKGAGMELGRFVVNSTLGIAGLFDPAERWLKWRMSDEDFGQTFGHYGAGTGFPIVLPFLGQSNLRDGLGMIPNFLLNPVYYATDATNYFAVTAGGQFNYLSLHGEEYEKLRKEALDPYTFFRDAHLQYRAQKVKE